MSDIVPAGCALCANHRDSDDGKTDASRAYKDTIGSQQNLEAGINCNNDQINNSNNSNELQTKKQGRKGHHSRSRNAKKQAGGGRGRVRNSYLKIVLDDESLDLMYGMAQRTQQVVRERFSDVPKDEQEEETSKVNVETSDKEGGDTDRGDSQPSKKQKPPRPLTFKPRSRNSLHMTYFFGGTTVCEIPPEELVEWHGQVMTRLQQASGPIGGDAESGETESSRYTLHFRELCLFPPRRNTLIVAIFNGSPELHKLHDDFRDIAINSDSDGLKEVVKRSKERWTAHVTLGDLHGGGRGEAKQEKLDELAKLLQDGLGLDAIEEKEDMMHSSNFTAKVKGIAMGGPVPSQVDLNWDYFF